MFVGVPPPTCPKSTLSGLLRSPWALDRPDRGHRYAALPAGDRSIAIGPLHFLEQPAKVRAIHAGLSRRLADVTVGAPHQALDIGPVETIDRAILRLGIR